MEEETYYFSLQCKKPNIVSYYCGPISKMIFFKYHNGIFGIDSSSILHENLTNYNNVLFESVYDY